MQQPHINWKRLHFETQKIGLWNLLRFIFLIKYDFFCLAIEVEHKLSSLS